jgi:RNA polymerase sigma factor (sigma-70 family)
MTMHSDELIPTRRSLLGRLKDWEDQESWKEFFDTYWKLVYSVAIKSGLNDSEAQDVVQETVLSVAKKMHDFKYEPASGSFKNRLLLITRRRVADHLRKAYRELPRHQSPQQETSRTSTIEKVPDPASLDIDDIWDQEWQKNLLEVAINRVRCQVDPKQFQIFDSYVLKQWPVKDVRKTLGVTAMQVYLAKHRISALIKKEIKKLEARRISPKC